MDTCKDDVIYVTYVPRSANNGLLQGGNRTSHASPPRPRGALADISCCLLLLSAYRQSAGFRHVRLLHMTQLSLHSGPERFTLGGGRSGSSSFLFYQWAMCRSGAQLMWCLLMCLHIYNQYGTCSPACMYKSSLTYFLFYMNWLDYLSGCVLDCLCCLCSSGASCQQTPKD